MVHIWSLWPTIRFLPSIVAETNATNNVLGRTEGQTDGRTEGMTDRGKTVYPLQWSGGIKHFPQYCVPIWRLWQNIRFLPSIVAEKNVTKNVHICSMCIKINKVGKQEVGIWRVQKTLPTIWYTYLCIWRLWPNIRFLPSTANEKSATKNILDGRKDGQR